MGDTIDLAERNQYGLFPGIAEFVSAQFLIGEDSLYQATVSYGKPDSVKIMRLRLTNSEVTRIKFMVENSKLIEERRQVDTITSNAVLDRFWSTIEARMIPDSVGVATQSKKGDKVTWIIRGTTVGATIGHFAATAVVSGMPGEMRVTALQNCLYGGFQETECAGCVGSPEPIYTINLKTYYLVTGLITGAGCVGGLLMDKVTTKKPSLNIQKIERTKKGTAIRVLTWIYSPMIAVGLMTGLGYATKSIIESSEDKKSIDLIELALPLGLVGFGVTFEFVRLGYKFANAVDRHENLKKTRHP